MRNKTSITILAMLISIGIRAQVPQVLNYQAVARNASGAILQNQHVGIRFSIHDGAPNATITYQETDTATTNQFGLFTTLIGNGTVTVGTFTGIAWATGNKYLEVELDPSGGNNYSDMGTTQLVSVPYALYASSSGTSGQITSYNILFNGVPVTDSSLNFAAVSTYQFITKTNYFFAISENAISTAAGEVDSIPADNIAFTDDTTTQSNIYVFANSDYPAGRIVRLGNTYGNIPVHDGQVYYVPLNATLANPTALFVWSNGSWSTYAATPVYQAYPNNSAITGFNLPNGFTVQFQRH